MSTVWVSITKILNLFIFLYFCQVFFLALWHENSRYLGSVKIFIHNSRFAVILFLAFVSTSVTINIIIKGYNHKVMMESATLSMECN